MQHRILGWLQVKSYSCQLLVAHCDDVWGTFMYQFVRQIDDYFLSIVKAFKLILTSHNFAGYHCCEWLILLMRILTLTCYFGTFHLSQQCECTPRKKVLLYTILDLEVQWIYPSILKLIVIPENLCCSDCRFSGINEKQCPRFSVPNAPRWIGHIVVPNTISMHGYLSSCSSDNHLVPHE